MRISLIGYGYWGPNLARNINNIEGAELAGICELNVQKREKAKSLYGDNLVYTDDYKELLKDDTVSAVAIATQTEVSYQIILDSLEAGKHVFVEKPIATTVERTKNIERIAKEKGLIVHCDHIMVFNPIIRYVKNMIETGELGDLMYIDVSRINLGPIRKDVNAMLDLAVHDIAVIDFLSNGKEPEEIVVLGQELYGKQESVTYLTLKYDSFIAHITSSWVSPLKERRTMIAGSEKMVIFDDVKMTEKLTIYNHGFNEKHSEEYGGYEMETRTGDIFIPHIGMEDSLKNSVQHFISCIEKDCESLTGPIHSLRVVKVLEQAMESLRK